MASAGGRAGGAWDGSPDVSVLPLTVATVLITGVVVILAAKLAEKAGLGVTGSRAVTAGAGVAAVVLVWGMVLYAERHPLPALARPCEPPDPPRDAVQVLGAARIQLGAYLAEMAVDPSLPPDVRAGVVVLGSRLPGVTGSIATGGSGDSASAAQAYVAAEVVLSGGSALGLRRPEGRRPLDSRDASSGPGSPAT